LNITTSLLRLASSLNISNPLGKSPHDYFLSRHEIGHPRHIVTLFGEDVLPSVLLDKERIGPRLIIANTGSLRFDLVSCYIVSRENKADDQFQGRFDQNDQLTVSPLYVQLIVASTGIELTSVHRHSYIQHFQRE